MVLRGCRGSQAILKMACSIFAFHLCLVIGYNELVFSGLVEVFFPPGVNTSLYV